MGDSIQINRVCKSLVFKTVLTDLVYSFRSSIKKLTGGVADVKLEQIRPTPIYVRGKVAVGRVRNLIGGRIACAFDPSLVNFINSETEYYSARYTPIELFATDMFDCFSSTSKSGMLVLNTSNLELLDESLNDSMYIRFDTRIFTKVGLVIPSRFIISVDEIASMYFKD